MNTVETRSRTASQSGPPEIRTKFFPIYIIYYQIQKADRPAIRDTDHPFQSQIIKGLKKTGPAPKAKKIIHAFTVQRQRHVHQLSYQLRLDSLMGSAVAESTDGKSCGCIY